MRISSRKMAASLVGAALACGIQAGVTAPARADAVPMGWELYHIYNDLSEIARKQCHADGRRLFGNQYKCSPGWYGWTLYFWS
ncbi:hypothetical protein ACBI99_16575 [Nonomuraea sp. ATR24]|uniref:hypothetical protein n=1 Tax=Nonomuraea TaxID=83681 RepID=UPI001C5D3424|nr:hypothetical protein [Nonomuraea ceibae]